MINKILYKIDSLNDIYFIDKITIIFFPLYIVPFFFFFFVRYAILSIPIPIIKIVRLIVNLIIR